MRLREIFEDGRIVKGVNTTVDVNPNEIKTQAAKFGNKVDKDGRPPTLSKRVKGKSTNVLFNLGLAEGYKLQLERDKELLVLHIKDTATGKRTEVRGKPGYETNYDPNDSLHILLDKVGKSANISELMNGEVVTINPKHPDADRAKAATDKAYNENFADGKTKAAIDKYQQTNTVGKTSRTFTDIEDEYLHIRELALKLIKNGLDTYTAYYKASEKMQFSPAMVFDWMGSEFKDEELEDFIPLEYEPDWIKRAELGMTENFADGKKKGKSRPGRVKKSGASCNGSVTALRKRAKNASGEKAKMYHWCANMKSGKKK